MEAFLIGVYILKQIAKCLGGDMGEIPDCLQRNHVERGGPLRKQPPSFSDQLGLLAGGHHDKAYGLLTVAIGECRESH